MVTLYLEEKKIKNKEKNSQINIFDILWVLGLGVDKVIFRLYSMKLSLPFDYMQVISNFGYT